MSTSIYKTDREVIKTFMGFLGEYVWDYCLAVDWSVQIWDKQISSLIVWHIIVRVLVTPMVGIWKTVLHHAFMETRQCIDSHAWLSWNLISFDGYVCNWYLVYLPVQTRV